MLSRRLPAHGCDPVIDLLRDFGCKVTASLQPSINAMKMLYLRFNILRWANTLVLSAIGAVVRILLTKI